MKETTHLELMLQPEYLSVHFQPILESTGGMLRIHAFEGLTRGPKGSNFATPDIIFSYARRKREESRIDRACVANILRSAKALPSATRISINVHASTLSRDAAFIDVLEREASDAGISTTRLIVEIVEHASAWDEWGFAAALDRLRRTGVEIALDDIGVGLSNYRMMLETQPNYFKIDRFFVSGAERDHYRRAVMESIAQLATKFGARVVAEGVETDSDLRVVTDLGINLFQGYFFSPPVAVQAADGFRNESWDEKEFSALTTPISSC